MVIWENVPIFRKYSEVLRDKRASCLLLKGLKKSKKLVCGGANKINFTILTKC